MWKQVSDVRVFNNFQSKQRTMNLNNNEMENEEFEYRVNAYQARKRQVRCPQSNLQDGMCNAMYFDCSTNTLYHMPESNGR